MLRSLLSTVLLGAVLLAASARAQVVSALYVPDSINKRVLSLDPATGAVLNPALIQDARLGTAVQAIQGFDRDHILVSDQTNDVVWQYTSTGTFVGVFAPAGGANTAILDNIRGIAISRDGQRLLVTVAAGGNINTVVAFDRTGAAVPTPVVASGAGGLNSPWDVVERAGDYLVGGSGNSTVLRFGLDGTPLGTFATGLNFPQQISESRAGGILVANFTPVAERGVYEYDAAGALLRRIVLPDLLGAARGVYDLASGTVLVATSAGIYEVARDGTVVSTKVSGGQYRYISPALAPVTATDAPAEGVALPLAADTVRYDVPLLTGAVPDVRAGDRAESAALRDLLAALAAADDGTDALVSEVEWRGPGRAVLWTTPAGGHPSIPVRLGRTGVADQLARLRAFWDQSVLPRPRARVRTVDLRFAGQVVTEEGDPQPDSAAAPAAPAAPAARPAARPATASRPVSSTPDAG